MSWYDADFKRREAVTVYNSAGTDPCDVSFTIPPDWDEFWTTIDTAGAELRVTDADGYTLVDYDVDDGSGGAFDKPNRAGRIRVDALNVSGDIAVYLLWLYWDATGAADASVAVTITSSIPAYVDLSEPIDRLLAAAPPRPGALEPTDRVGKSAAERLSVWVDLTDTLEPRRAPFAESSRHEEPWLASPAAYDDGGVLDASIVDLAECRFVEAQRRNGRRIYVRVAVEGGTSGEVFTVRVPTKTRTPASPELHRVLEPSFALLVRDPLETT